jgi:hypothetical protein
VDTILLGTGFAATEFLLPMRITGRGGRDLHEQWKDGASAYLGAVVPGFPKLHPLRAQHQPGANSIIVMLEAQIGWVVQAVRAVQRGRVRWLDVRRSWYLTESGRNTQNWPASTLTFRRRLRRFRLGDFEPAPAPGPA